MTSVGDLIHNINSLVWNRICSKSLRPQADMLGFCWSRSSYSIHRSNQRGFIITYMNHCPFMCKIEGSFFNKLLSMNIFCVYEYFHNVFFHRIVIKMFRSLRIPCCRPASSIQSTSTSSNQNPCLIIIIILIIQSEPLSHHHHLYHPKPARFCLTVRALIMWNVKLWEETWEIKAKTTRSPKFLSSVMVSVPLVCNGLSLVCHGLSSLSLSFYRCNWWIDRALGSQLDADN